MLTCQNKKPNKRDIQLPKSNCIEMPKPNKPSNKSHDNLAEMNNFDDQIAYTPPDRGFMDNLMRRMGRA